jgi:hypothetical protein
VAQYDGNRGWRSAIAALAAVGNSGKSAPEVGGEQALWQGGGVVDRFEVRKRSEGGSPELSTVALVANGETAMKGRTGGRGGKRLGREATRRCTGARGRVGSGFGGVGVKLHGGSTIAAWQRSGGWRAEDGERVLHEVELPL